MEKIMVTQYDDVLWEYGRAHDWFVDAIFFDDGTYKLTGVASDVLSPILFGDDDPAEVWFVGTLHNFVREFSTDEAWLDSGSTLMFVMRDAKEGVWKKF